MKNIKIYPIKSILANNDLISNDSATLIKNINEKLDDYKFEIISNFNNVNEDDFVLILVQSGGSEGIFKNEIFNNYKGPYYLLTYGASNSLAASLEILTFIKQNNRKSEVLHGNIDYIVDRIKYLYQNKNCNKLSRLGVFGKPSDWLISSNVDYKKCKEIFNIELVDVDQDIIIENINKINDDNLYKDYDFKYDNNEINKALKIYKGLVSIVDKYNLDGFTIRCFDIISIIKSSACLGLALFNNDNIIATCEGDIPSMISAKIVYDLLGIHAFQANPQWINQNDNTIEFAHCTLPLDMATNITLDTHFESGIGVGIHGELKKDVVTIFKINNELDEFYCTTGKIIDNEYRKDRCRTQIKIKLDSDVSYFLISSLGNHHQIIYGNHEKSLSDYLESFGLRKVTI